MCEAEETTIHVGDISMVHQYTSTFPGTEVVKNCPAEYKGTQNNNIFKTFRCKMKKMVPYHLYAMYILSYIRTLYIINILFGYKMGSFCQNKQGRVRTDNSQKITILNSLFLNPEIQILFLRKTLKLIKHN